MKLKNHISIDNTINRIYNKNKQYKSFENKVNVQFILMITINFALVVVEIFPLQR